MIVALLGLVAAGMAAMAIVECRGRRRTVGMAVATALVPILIVADQWNAPQIEALRDSPVLAAAVILAGILLIVAGAAVIRKWPSALPLLLVLALPFRVPVGVGGDVANLLVPFYLVTAAGVFAALWRDFGSTTPGSGDVGAKAADLSPTDGQSASGGGRVARLARWFRPLLAISVLAYAVAILYSEDRSSGLLDLGFFLVPFAITFALVTEIEWSDRVLRQAAVAVFAMVGLFSLIGFIEWRTGSLIWNEAVIRSNDFHVYFRVNSLFWDPNIFGRYLALAVTIAATALAWTENPRRMLGLTGILVVFSVALFSTYSQSSFVALLAALAAVVALRWSLRAVLAGLAVLAVAVLLFGTFAGGVIKLDLGALNKQTSGRANLVEGGIELFGNRPVFGYGAGSFPSAFKRVVVGADAQVVESHTEPVTVAAEQGVIGLMIYFGLIITALCALTIGFRRVMPGLGLKPDSADPARGPPAARAAVFACFVALLVHTLTYAGFLDDPVTWFLLALGSSLAATGRRDPDRGRSEA